MKRLASQLINKLRSTLSAGRLSAKFSAGLSAKPGSTLDAAPTQHVCGSYDIPNFLITVDEAS